ncbi:MAG TPA: ATP synthase F0 subunit C [Terriglobales bacterium]|nr:ATP synthase F0 subunit C [Terriglobales bacterium]
MRKSTFFMIATAILTIASPLYAQTAGGTGATFNWAVPIGAAIGMGIASGLCGLGQGRATASAAEALARNPGARPGIMFALILGLALIESLALYTLVIVFAKVK